MVNKSGMTVVHEYCTKQPDQRKPDCKTFEAVKRHLRETGMLKQKLVEAGRRFVRNPNTEEEILNALISYYKHERTVTSFKCSV